MTLVLVDTSAWIHYFRRGDSPLADALETLLEERRAALAGVPLAEVRQGLRPPEEATVLALLELLPWVDTTRDDFECAGLLLAGLRRRGVSIPTTDGVVAAQCLNRGMALLEDDRHFGEVEGLEVVAWRQG